MDILTAIQSNLKGYALIPENRPVVAAVSGGADSVALLYAFKKLNIPCTVAHLNHQLRGTESDTDEQFVRNLADSLGYPVKAVAADVRQMANESGDSIEMAARRARHRFFETFGDAVIALAHHADDQAETFLLKLARGAGPEGLGGMTFTQTIGPLHLIRPLLNLPRKALMDWLQTEGLIWREDSSNCDESYLRNKVRRTILPLLEQELNPNLRNTLLRTMDILREENALLDELAGQETLQTCTSRALKRRLLRNWLFDQGSSEVSFEAVEQILNLMDASNGTSIYELNDTQRVIIEYGMPRFDSGEAPLGAMEWELTVSPSMGWMKDSSRIGEWPATAAFNAEKIGDSTIQVRTMQPGDRMTPLGMQGSRKLQDIFTDLKIPRLKRKQLPLVTCREEIIWIPGYRIARGWAVADPSEPSIRIRIDQKRTD